MNSIEEIVKHYNSEIKKEYDVVKPLLEKYIKEGRKKYSEILQRMFSFYMITQYISHYNNHQFIGKEMELVGILNKIELNFWGIYSCLKNGALIEAMVIKRSMLESVVTLNVILKENTAERLKLFSNYKHILRWKQIEKHEILDVKEEAEALKNGSNYKKFNSDMSKSDYDIYKKNYENLKSDYPNKNCWYGKEFKSGGIKSLFEHLGGKYPREYIAVYSTNSSLIHGGSNVTDYYSDFDNPKGNVISNIPKFDELIISIGVTSMEICSRALIAFLRYFNFLTLEKLDIYIEIFIDTVFDDFELVD